MWLQFFAQNAHFAIHLFAALVCMGVCWLYLDAWSNRHAPKELFKWVGFALLGLSFLAQATSIEQTVLGSSLLGDVTNGVIVSLRILGFLGIIIGNIIDPLQAVPKNEGLVLEEKKDATAPPAEPTKTAPTVVATFGVIGKWLVPIEGFAVAGLYWRRATTGLERHLKPVARAFFLIALSDLIGLVALLRGTSNPVLYNWVAAFGWLWWLQQFTLLAGVIMLGFWTWFYLVERFFSQLYMIFIAITVFVFLTVSVGFTSLLLGNVQSEALVNLDTAAHVLDYAVSAKKSETSSAAQQLAQNSDIVSAVSTRDRAKLMSVTSDFLTKKQLTNFIITNQSGQVLLRGQDSSQWGDSISDDALVKRALVGLDQSTITVSEGVGAPIIRIRSASAMKDSSGTVTGSSITEFELGSAFVDGIKQATNLQSSVYAGKALAATTLVGPDGKTRPLGAKLTNNSITNTVLTQGKTYSGTVNLQNRQMLGAFLPIKDVDNVTVGTLLVAEPESTILITAGHSVELTFLLTAALLILSLAPIYLITRSLVKQLN